MSDIIKLLPDSVANQIAAGEVVQRPASVVKELLENAIDAKATDIQLIIKDAGRTLIQTIDNGCGMSETDARMCFERHATSKITQANDLLSIRTFGFRGEAMASIAAVAQVELRSKRAQDELGTEIFIEGSVIKSQQPCSTPTGTSTAVKNLFFNVPARRKFLKSENVELRHIIDELTRVAMVNPHVRMEMNHNGKNIFVLPKSTLKERIINLLGNNLSNRLLPIETETNYVKITGFLVKPEFAKKNRGEQFFFVNHRYIRSPFLHHAVENACSQLLPENSTPGYFIFFEMNPEDIDINIHPTKTEVKFTDEQMMYQFLMAAVKQSIGQYNITPSLDFDNPLGANFIPARTTVPSHTPHVNVDPYYNPFTATKNAPYRREALQNDLHHPQYADKLFGAPNAQNTSDLHTIFQQVEQEVFPEINEEITFDETDDHHAKQYLYIGNRLIITTLKSDLLLIDYERALERIFFERHIQKIRQQKGECQKLLFPKTIDLSKTETLIFNEIAADLNNLGFDISEFGENSFIIHGIPSGVPQDFDVETTLHEMMEQHEKGSVRKTLSIHENIALTLARRMAAQYQPIFRQEETDALLEELFATEAPQNTPDGKVIIKVLNADEVRKWMDFGD